MSGTTLHYHPDRWAHDLGQWWHPLAALARGADCGSDDWLAVLGVGEFFDNHLIGQPAVFTPWICLAAAAVSAAAARNAADPEAAAGAAVAFELAASLQRLRWRGQKVSTARTSSAELVRAGRAAVTSDLTKAVALVAGWLVVSGHSLAHISGAPAEQRWWFSETAPPSDIVASIAGSSPGRPVDPDPLWWGTAHLVERLAQGTLDDLALPIEPDGPPAEASAKVLLVSAGRGEMGLFEARRQRSLLPVPAGQAVPDLARLAFIRPSEDFVGSVTDSLAAARRVHDGAELLARAGEVISWSLQLAGDGHPLAERGVSGRSAGLGAYVAFRSLTSPGTFAARNIAFTGQVADDGGVGPVLDAKGKLEAAAEHRIRLVVHPDGQAWRDPAIRIQLEGVSQAEDAVVLATKHLRYLRDYLEATCQLVTPEPWLEAWLERQGRPGAQVPLLDVMCRRTVADDGSAVANFQLDTFQPDVPDETDEVTIQRCAAHLLATRYPNLSFAIRADAGAGMTVAAKRMAAESARRALDALRAAATASQPGAFTLPLYLPLWEQPSDWDDLVRASVDAVPGISEPRLDVAAALAGALRGDTMRGWRALVIADGTDRLRPPTSPAGPGSGRDLVDLLARGLAQDRPAWHPKLAPQIVLFGRIGSPAHQRTVDSLRRLRPDSVAVAEFEPLSDREIGRFAAAVAPGTSQLADWNRDLVANPLLLALSVIAGHPSSECGATDLFDRGLDVLLGARREQRPHLAQIAFRAATAKGEPAGEFDVSDIAAPGTEAAVEIALGDDDQEGALWAALRKDERRAFLSAELDSHLLTASPRGWRFFHDRAFAFLVADQIARRATLDEADDEADDDAVFGVIAEHLNDSLWADVIEATGRLLELRSTRLTPS